MIRETGLCRYAPELKLLALDFIEFQMDLYLKSRLIKRRQLSF